MNMIRLFSKLYCSRKLNALNVKDHVGYKSLGESSILSPDREKKAIKKRSIDGYLSIFDGFFLSRWAKSGLSLIWGDLAPLKSRLNCYSYIILLFIALILCSCSKSKESQYYVLTALPPQKISHNFYNRLQIGIDGVTIPDSIKKNQLMINQSPHHLNIEEFNQWAGPLDNNITLVLSTNLSTLIPGSIVQVAPFNSKFHPDYHLQVNMSQFEIDIHGTSILRAEYIIYRQEKLIYKGNTYYHSTTPVVSTEALVTSMNTNLTRLSKEIAHFFIKNNKVR